MGVVLDNLLSRLEPFLQTPDLEELCAARPQEVLLEIAKQGWQTREAPELTLEYWERLCFVLSNVDGGRFDVDTQPKVSTRLPGGHRFEATIGKPMAETQMGIAIRIKRKVQVSLTDFGLPEFLQTKIIEAMERGENIIVSGGTSSGKTTFLNCLIQYIPLIERIITIEDTRELDVPHNNREHFLVSRNEKDAVYGYNDAFDQSMRKRPDRILAGELSIANALYLIPLLDTGHKGFMTTVHSNSCRLAIEKTIPKKVGLSGHPSHDVGEYLRDNVEWVIQIQKVKEGTSAKRQITEVWQPQNNYFWHWKGNQQK